MLTQALLPIRYIPDSDTAMTSFAGLPLYMDLAMASGLCSKITTHLQVKERGWTDLQIIMSLILLNLSGGTCIDDIDRLESDEGLRSLLLKIETYGMKRKARRVHERRWRKQKERAFPSSSAIHRYLETYHSSDEEKKRLSGKAFIPANSSLLDSLVDINQELITSIQAHHPIKTATLDQDATLCPTSKLSALHCYKKFKAYQPFNTYWYEQGILLHSEFRDGNVNAGFEQLRLLKLSLDRLPQSVESVSLRSDSAGYQENLLRYCAEGESTRFGVIEFAISAKVTAAYKAVVVELEETDWQPVYISDGHDGLIKTDQEWAEVCFVPGFAARSKQGTYRYLAIRRPLAVQLELGGVESPKQQEFPFQTLKMESTTYKITALVTNSKQPGNALIRWHRERCGKSEKVHSIQKSDLSGGQFPSDKFGANAAWWHIMILTHNLHCLMKQQCLPKELRNKRFKSIRFHVIGVAGCLVSHARSLSIKLSGGRRTFELFELIRRNILALVSVPSPPPQAA